MEPHKRLPPPPPALITAMYLLNITQSLVLASSQRYVHDIYVYNVDVLLDQNNNMVVFILEIDARVPFCCIPFEIMFLLYDIQFINITFINIYNMLCFVYLRLFSLLLFTGNGPNFLRCSST